MIKLLLKSWRNFFVILLCLLACNQSLYAGPLEDYVAKPDPAYFWRVVASEHRPEGTVTLIRLTSQSWRSANDVDHVVWQHWLEVYVPLKVEVETAFLSIGGGSDNDPQPDKADGFLGAMAIRLNAVTARVRQVPNQPLVFVADPLQKRRMEDSIISFGWARFLESEDPEWLPLLPMTKAAVRAMDAVTAFCASDKDHPVTVKNFVVTGASKRGWTTWLTAAVDPRVVGIAPHVIDLLDMNESFRHHHEAYGRYSDAVHDYEENGVLKALGTPAMDKAIAIIDPYAYRAKLRMPKLLVNSSGDQFFVLDSWRFYWDQIEGPKWLRYVPNTNHSLDSSAGETTQAFFTSIVNGHPFPQFTWREEDGGRIIRVEAATQPQHVSVWRAANSVARNFILHAGASEWKQEPLQAISPGIYIATQAVPEKGWSAMVVELAYPDPSGLDTPLRLTTGIAITPATMPFPTGDKTPRR